MWCLTAGVGGGVDEERRWVGREVEAAYISCLPPGVSRGDGFGHSGLCS